RRPPDRTRSPAPVGVAPDPATVVIRSPAPGSGVDPAPAVVAAPDPAAGAVRRPRRADVRRRPHAAVLGLLAPSAVLVEIADAVDLLRDAAAAGGREN